MTDDLFTAAEPDHEPLWYSVVVLGDPMPWERAGATIMGKPPKQFIKFYPPKATKEREELVAKTWRASGIGHWPEGRPLALRVSALFARPAYHFGTGRNADEVKARYEHAHPGKGGGQRKGQPRTGGDLDNIVKLVKDGLSGVAYLDDGQVCEIAATKGFVDHTAAQEPQTIIALRALR